jgi:hypothetical protein
MTINKCKTCHGLNAAIRVHCQYCGTYQHGESLQLVRAEAATYVRGCLTYNHLGCIPIVAAQGVERQEDRRSHRVYMRTVSLDYYGGEVF